MATKQYLVPTTADGNFGALVDGTTQTAATRADGWTVAKNASPLSCEFDVGTKQASGSFSSNSTTPKPASFLTGTTANAFKTPAALAGVFDVGNWVFTFAVRATTASSQAGRIRMRVFKSVNADGSSATELTSATQVGTTSAALSTTADVTSVVTWAPGTTIALNNEYLFFVIAWEITTASGSNSGDVQIRTGQTTPAGSYLNTPNYTANTAASGTDVSGTTTESASITRIQLTDVDATGFTEIETAAPKYIPVSADTNGTTTENGSVVVGNTYITAYEPDQISNYSQLQSDFTSYATLQAAFPSYASLQVAQQPLPVLTEAASVSIPVTGTDSGTISESASVVAKISDTESGSGSDTALLVAKLTATDADGTPTEVALVALPATDVNGATTEASSLVAKLIGTDADGVITESVSQAMIVTDSITTNEVGNAVQQITPVSSSDTNGTVTESVSIIVTTSDVNAGISEITSLVLSIPDTNGATTESATPKAVLTATDATGTITEVGSTAQFSFISGTDTNGTVTESAAFNAAYVGTDSGVISEITSLAQGTTDNGTASEVASVLFLPTVTDSNGAVTESSLPLRIATTDVATGSEVYALTAQIPSTDANITTESALLVVVTSVTDSNGVVTESGAVTHIIITDTDSNLITTEGIGNRTLGALDTNGIYAEVASLNTPVTTSDTGLGASESASTAVAPQIVSDTGLGVDSAVAGVLLAPSDTIFTAEAVSLVAKLSTADQNSLTTEISVIVFRVTLSDSGIGSETQRIGISLSDSAAGSDTATNTAAQITDVDFNGVTDEITSIYVTGSRPIGKIPSITAIDGVDKTSITAAGLSTSSLTDVNAPDRGILVEVNSVDSGILIAVNGVDRG